MKRALVDLLALAHACEQATRHRRAPGATQ
jgi:hypothetical protein